MKTKMTLSVALMAAGLHADTLRLANGLEFRIPAGSIGRARPALPIPCLVR